MATETLHYSRQNIVDALTEFVLDDSWQGAEPTKKDIWQILERLNVDEKSPLRYQLLQAGMNKKQVLYGAILMAKTLFPEHFEA